MMGCESISGYLLLMVNACIQAHISGLHQVHNGIICSCGNMPCSADVKVLLVHGSTCLKSLDSKTKVTYHLLGQPKQLVDVTQADDGDIQSP